MLGNAAVVALRLQLALLWWRLCALLLRVLHTQSLKPASQYFHKVVVIGDDFAAGIGDYVTLGKPAGLAHHLAPLVARSDKVTTAIIHDMLQICASGREGDSRKLPSCVRRCATGGRSSTPASPAPRLPAGC